MIIPRKESYDTLIVSYFLFFIYTKCMVTVGVVIPYSSEHTTTDQKREAIKSVEKQHIDTEIYVIEGGPGPAWARNRGLEKAKEQYVAFLDADDLWMEGKLECQLARLNETDSGICVEGDPSIQSRFIELVLAGEILGVTSSILIDTEKISATFDETLTRREDHDFLVRATNEAGVCLCPNLIKNRKHDGGLTSETTREMDIQSGYDIAERVKSNFEDPDNYLPYVYQGIMYDKGMYAFQDEEFSTARRRFARAFLKKPTSPKGKRAVAAFCLCISEPITRRFGYSIWSPN